MADKRKFFLIKIVIALLILGAFLLYTGYLDLRKFRREISKLNEKINKMDVTNESLRAEIKALREDNFYIEKVVRENLGLVKPGEVVYKIIPEKQKK